jgi:hypothetical protein
MSWAPSVADREASWRGRRTSDLPATGARDLPARKDHVLPFVGKCQACVGSHFLQACGGVGVSERREGRKEGARHLAARPPPGLASPRRRPAGRPDARVPAGAARRGRASVVGRRRGRPASARLRELGGGGAALPAAKSRCARKGNGVAHGTTGE